MPEKTRDEQWNETLNQTLWDIAQAAGMKMDSADAFSVPVLVEVITELKKAKDLTLEIGKRFEDILTDDNRCTADPIFLVQQKKRTHGFDPEYAEEYDWVDMGDGDYTTVSRGEEDFDLLEQMNHWQWLGDFPSSWEKSYYVDTWVTVHAFFTEAAADLYIQVMSHRMAEEVRTYVDSAYRNYEWQYLRKVLSQMALEAQDA